MFRMKLRQIHYKRTPKTNHFGPYIELKMPDLQHHRYKDTEPPLLPHVVKAQLADEYKVYL